MSDKEKIKKEIERRFDDNIQASEQYMENSKSRALFTSAAKEDYDLLAFIDSLPEEPANKDSEEEIGKYIYSLPHSADGFWPKDIDCYSQEARTKYGVYHYWGYEQVMNIARHFAEWQKQQMKEALQTEYEKGRFDMREEMVKDAVEAEVMYPASSSTLQIRYKLPKNTKLKYGDRVKTIILKTEQQ